MPKLYLSQNATLKPVYDAWHFDETDNLLMIPITCMPVTKSHGNK